MLFNSFHFLLFFIVVTFVYFSIEHKYRWFLLLVASCYFYMALIPIYILILGFTIVVDYFAGIMIENAQGKKRKLFLLTSLVANIGVLAVFKYYNFINENIAAVLGGIGTTDPFPYLAIALPIGLSFHTFQAMSYTIEVYRGHQKAERHFGIYALYVMFFPQLVAGPIEKATHLLPQFRVPKTFDYERVRSGCVLIVWGLFKKVVVADRLGVFVNKVYGSPETSTGIVAIIATLFFAAQLYLDFSAYSEIALGTARILGFELVINFKRPYLATSFGNFWNRWHISLNSWFREYLYVPLGGNRISALRTHINVIIVFMISGLWHGASWNFVIWGAINGFYLLALDPLLFSRNPKGSMSLIAKVLRGTLIMVFWSLSLVFFRAETFADAITIYRHFSFAGMDQLYKFGLGEFAFKFVLGMVALVYVVELVQEMNYNVKSFLQTPLPVRWSVYILLPLAVIYLGAYGLDLMDSAFIYFQF